MNKKEPKKVLSYFKNMDSWFVSIKTTKQAEVITYHEYARRVNIGELDWRSDHTDDTYSSLGEVMIVKDKETAVGKEADPPPPGLYSLTYDDNLGVGIKKTLFESDKWVDLNNNYVNKIEKDITAFFDNEQGYRDMGLTHKRGILLYGPPGTGKTMLIKHVVSMFKDKARIIIAPSYTRVSLLSNLREPLNDMHTIFVFEELTSDIENGAHLTAFLNFLDGEDSWDKCLVIATTNYPRKLPGNVVDRPSRFDKIYKVSFPPKGVRKKYLEHMMGDEWLTDDILDDTEGFSIAYLKELCISCKLYKIDANEMIKEFRDRKEKIKKEFDDEKDELGNKKRGVGFSRYHYDDGF